MCPLSTFVSVSSALSSSTGNGHNHISDGAHLRREREAERETRGYEPFALHKQIQCGLRQQASKSTARPAANPTPLLPVQAAAEREVDTSKYYQGFGLNNGSSQRQDLAVTVSCVPNSLDCGNPPCLRCKPTSQAETESGSEEGSCLRHIDFCITQLCAREL